MVASSQLILLPSSLVPPKEEGLKAYESALWNSEYRALLESLDGILCESERGARALLSHWNIHLPLYVCPKALASESTLRSKSSYFEGEYSQEKLWRKKVELAKDLLRDVLKGDRGSNKEATAQRWGLLCDAGLCGVADPGSVIVYAAREGSAFEVSSYYGMSSISLALSLSGLEGQAFSFEGYIPHHRSAEKERGAPGRAHGALLSSWERMSAKEGRVMIWMETPYRHREMVERALEGLSPRTLFCVASNLTSQREVVVTATVQEWLVMQQQNRLRHYSRGGNFSLEKAQLDSSRDEKRSSMRFEELLELEAPTLYLLRSYS